MSHHHEKLVCAHGMLVLQCRCIEPKTVKVVACPPECLLGGNPFTVEGRVQDGAHRISAATPPQICDNGDECPCADCKVSSG